MKTKILILTLVTMFTTGINSNAQTSSGEKKALIVYYSWSGNTREIANQIKSITGADILEILPVNAYPTEYDKCTVQAKKEINSDFKPAIQTKIDNIDNYDVIFVGSPNWWSTIAPPVATLLSDYDFSGKTIIPFMTHGGSRMGRSVTDIKKLCPGSTVLDGLPIRGSSSKSSKAEVEKWLKDINMIN